MKSHIDDIEDYLKSAFTNVSEYNAYFNDTGQKVVSSFMFTSWRGPKFSCTSKNNHPRMTSFSCIIFGGGTQAQHIPAIGGVLNKTGLFGCRIYVDDDGDLVFELEVETKNLEEYKKHCRQFELSIDSLTNKFGPLPVEWD
ncbi:hypothetical protein [Hoeflea alexandrii]|uniref:Uncharacterized protein n=1 Tax=Hoeflea alexandrii TaxID=288436 RepID=A0ABT1CQ75_9HYPH|nr:hypothetical protein [Hoeflea alexandrii]MCO6408329.1 hypothetical protein [Hoeflea alexandrii]MCY0153380.1 hypothetical protein [Hoeflea alexandrii]